MGLKNKRFWILGWIFFVILFALAPKSGLKTTTYFFLMIKYICLCISFNLIAGYVGYISFGHVAFYGIGGYTTALLFSKAHLSSYPYLCILFGGVGGAIAGYLLGKVLFKLRGAYFAIATLALNEALKVIVFNIPEEFSGGTFGIPLPALRNPDMAYYLMLLVTSLSFLFILYLINSPFGITLKAIREDEDGAMAIGIDAPKYKIRAFVISTFLMGIAGAIDLQFIGYIYPEAAFFIETNVEVIAMTMLGGIGTLLGPVAGSTILFMLSDFIWSKWPFSHLIMLGIVICMLVLFMPRGIFGLLDEKISSLRGKIK